MKTLFAAFALAALVANPVLAQTAAEAITGIAKDAAAQAATDSVNKAVGKKGEKDAKAKRDKDGPNWGTSEDHRRDDERGHKGKKKTQ